MGEREGTGVERWTASAQLPEGEAAASTQSQVSLHIQVGIQKPPRFSFTSLFRGRGVLSHLPLY